MKKRYTGFIKCAWTDGIGLQHPESEEEIDLTREIESDIEKYGSFLQVTYYISDTPKSPDEMLMSFIENLIGVGTAGVTYAMGSEWTGEYCIGSEITVGGHDLERELYNHMDKYLQLDIIYSKSKQDSYSS